jgi:hypothetical protein
VIKSSADHFESSRGSLSGSISTLPPSGLAIVTATPRWVSSKYGCVSSAPQNPVGQPKVVDVAGLATTISTVFGLDDTRSTRVRWSATAAPLPAVIGLTPLVVTVKRYAGTPG